MKINPAPILALLCGAIQIAWGYERLKKTDEINSRSLWNPFGPKANKSFIRFVGYCGIVFGIFTLLLSIFLFFIPV